MRSQRWCLFVLLVFCSARTEAADWPQFLGPDRNGISSEGNLIEAWPENGPKQVWRADGGIGMSGLAICQDKVVTMVQDDGQQQVLCLDAKTGDAHWRTPVAPAYRNPQGNGPRATPVITGDRVIAFTGEGILVALDLATGTTQWSHDVISQLGAKIADYGMACSPLVVGDRVVVTLGAPDATVAAFQIDTGNLAWKAGLAGTAGYSSPALLNVGGRSQIVAFAGKAVLGIEPKSGELLWQYPFETDFDCNIATPVAYQDRVFISAGENHGCALLQLVPDGDKFQATPVWSSEGVKSVLRNEWQTSLLIGGLLYGFDNVGSAGPVTHLTCVNATTGERVWRKSRFGKGNQIAADGKLFISTMAGELVVVEATPDGYVEMGRLTVLESTRQAPSLSGGFLYLRDDAHIICIDVRRND